MTDDTIGQTGGGPRRVSRAASSANAPDDALVAARRLDDYQFLVTHIENGGFDGVEGLPARIAPKADTTLALDHGRPTDGTRYR